MTIFSTTPTRSLDEPGLADHFLRLVGDECGAVDLVVALLDDGVPAPRILIDLIASTQMRVGRLWAADKWSIAREHAATAISERAVAAVSARTRVRPTRGRITVACVDGEWHSLPVRLLAELLRLDGWRVDFLGANVPCAHLVTHLHQTGPDAVALSCMPATRRPGAHAAIAAGRTAGVPVIAGGPGFGPGGRYARQLGADAWAADATEALDRLATAWPRPRQEPQFAAPAAVLGDEEYAYVVQERPTLIDTTIRRLADLYPAVEQYHRRQLDATAEDLGHVVDFLAAALYVSEPEIFTDFVAWTTALLQVRGVPPVALGAGLRLIHEQLGDYPTAQADLEAAIIRLTP
ncbi:cobalamin B12-binding domain-containing protein [Micromonosporaceae bacterium Da 78-11]